MVVEKATATTKKERSKKVVGPYLDVPGS